MGTITISIDDDVETDLRKFTESTQRKKGALGNAVSQALKAWLNDKQEEEIAQRQIIAMKHGHALGKRLFTAREELHGRSSHN